MIKKVKQLAGHYWMDHKIEVVIFAVLVVSLIIKQILSYGDSQDELLLYRFTDCNVNSPGFLRRTTCPIDH